MKMKHIINVICMILNGNFGGNKIFENLYSLTLFKIGLFVVVITPW